MNNLDEKDLLARELRERAGDVAGHPVSFTAVRASAKRLQRRRQVVTGAVAAAVAGIALPTGVAVTAALNDNGTDTPGYVTGPSASASPTDASSATALTPPSEPVRLTLQGLERGEAPAIPYFRLGETVTPEGTFDTDIVMQALVRRADGWIGLGYAGKGEQVFFMDENMNVTGEERSGQRLAASSDGSLVSYVRVDEDGSQTLLSAAELDAMSWTFPEFPTVEPVGYVGPGDVVYQTYQGGRRGAGIAYGDGSTEPVKGFVTVADANEKAGLVAGQTRSNPDASGCFGVMEPETSTTEMLWEGCDYSLTTFSPDGRFVLAGPAYLSGMGNRDLAILDAETGRPVVEYTQPRKGQVTLTSAVWESEDTVLAVAQEATTWTIVRMSVDGRLEQAVEPLEGDPFGDLPFFFSQTDLPAF